MLAAIKIAQKIIINFAGYKKNADLYLLHVVFLCRTEMSAAPVEINS